MRIVPVVVLESEKLSQALADALVEGGIGCAEITLRTEASLAVIKEMSGRGDMFVGAGTVLTVEHVDQAVDAGAQFLLSPGLDLRVIERAQELAIPFIPGVATASEVMTAMRAGLDHLKFFPAMQAGGLSTLSALHGPFPSVRFIPTGGITLATLNDFYVHPAVFAVGGSWMVPTSALDSQDFDQVRRITRDTMTQIAALDASVD